MNTRSIIFLAIITMCIVADKSLATITIVGDIPAMTIIENRDNGLNDGSTIVGDPSAATYFVKGQTFTLASTEEIRNLYIRMDENNPSVDDVGSLTIEFFNSVGGEPTAAPNSGGAIHAQTDPFPTGAGLGEYLEINLASPVTLNPGEYAFSLFTNDLNLNFDVQSGGDEFPDGTLVRHNGTAWQIRPIDFIFGLTGESPEPLKIVVDRETGGVMMENANNAGLSYDLDYYEIKSDAGSLNESGWTSFADQDLPGFPSGDGSGNGWEEGGNNNANQLIESYLLGSSTFAVGQSESLGNAFTPGRSEDLTFAYHAPGAPSPTTGLVEYVGVAIVDGDFDGNGLWNCADINALSAAIASGSTDPSFDMNGDGVVTAEDITDAGVGWLAVGGANNPGATGGNAFLNGDANLDGTVDGPDFLPWNINKFSNLPEWCGGDWNADGTVDGPDFLIWNTNKFMSADHDVVTVPEPLPLPLGLLLYLMGASCWARKPCC